MLDHEKVLNRESPLANAREELSAHVQTIVPNARIEAMALPAVPQLALFLINSDYPRGPIPNELAQRLMDQPFYWAFCWASGAVLAEHILRNPNLVEGKTVIDFGCGSGVVAIAAALAGAARVMACDIDPWAIKASQANALFNGVTLNYAEDFFDIDEHVDVVVAADVLYDRENLPWLDNLRTKAASVLLADSRLKDFSHPAFERVDRVSACTLPDLDESQEFRWVNIYQSLCGSSSQK